MAKTALITGVTGQDGSYLAELLLGKGYTVYGFVRRSSNPRMDFIKGLPVRLIYGDMLDPHSLYAALEESQPDEVYNLAAQSHVGLSFSQPSLTTEVNANSVINLLSMLRKSDTRFYQASTSEMFGVGNQELLDETTAFLPQSPYGVSKLAAYWTTVNYRTAYHMFACSGILFNHESPRRGLDFVTRKISMGVARIHHGYPGNITLGNVHTRRDWGFAGDYVEAMWKMMQLDHPENFVIATGESHSIQDFLRIAFEYIGIKDWEKYVTIDPALFRPNEVWNLVGDASKAKKLLNWQPQVGFEELVAMMVESDLRKVKQHEN